MPRRNCPLLARPGLVIMGNMHRFLIVIEKVKKNFSAYSPDLPGCIATGATLEKTEKNMHVAMALHIQGMRDNKQAIPKSSSFAEYIAIPA